MNHFYIISKKKYKLSFCGFIIPDLGPGIVYCNIQNGSITFIF